MEHFAPTVHVPSYDGRSPGYVFTPEGWMWLIAFALRGIEWAIQEASKPEFRQHILASLKERRRANLKACIEEKLDEIEHLRKELRLLDEPPNPRRSP